MAKRKDLISEILNDFFDIVERFLPLYTLMMIGLWLTNRAVFWKWSFYTIAFFAVILATAIWRRKAKIKLFQENRSGRQLLLNLKGMSPAEFEEYVADLFFKLGYKTQTVGGSYDGGIDVIAEKKGVKHYIQCKKFITQTVGVGAVREFYGAITDHLSDAKGYFITTNKFTLEAEIFAEDKPIELIDGQKLIDYIRRAEKENNELNSPPAEKCPQCGGDLIERSGKFGKFYGCSNYPKCRFAKDFK